MKAFFIIIIATLFPYLAVAENIPKNPIFKPVEFTFNSTAELSARQKPRNRINTTQEALDFILADQIVQKSISAKIAEGYSDWKANAERSEYDDIWIVRVDSTSAIPPYTCYFRFDSIGNDKRDIPANGCQYE